MKNLLLIISLVISFNSFGAEKPLDLRTIEAPDAHGDSIHEVLSDMKTESDCFKAVETIGYDIENDQLRDDIQDAANDQCSNQKY